MTTVTRHLSTPGAGEVELVGLSVDIGERDRAGGYDVSPAAFFGREQTVTIPGPVHAGFATGMG